MPPPLVSSMMTILMTNDPGGDLVHLLVVAGGDLLHLLVVLPPSKAGQACLPLVLHMLMPEVFPEIVSKYLSKNILSYFS